MSDLSPVLGFLSEHVYFDALAVLLAVLLVAVLRGSFVYIPNTQYGIVERRWSARRTREPFAPMAVNGNAGFLPEVLRGGLHTLQPFQYVVHKRPLIAIDQIAYLVARVGRPLESGQALAEWPHDVAMDDARAFLDGGGQAGPQRRILRSGTYAINTALFAVITEDDIHHLAEAKKDDAQFQAMLIEPAWLQPRSSSTRTTRSAS